ncbi:alpha/beta fold hydrolase [Nonomuraea sp. SYSU D8015]|uniref:alpha/beta fold hydrolase n=1 Tax=Nonomuraea sp. SYSU D8015 TaxID=2593644 RepID=UPI001CB72EC7|nr:alpha/beta hydrolase [Nonomuraea sp. SYSU D8015]
MSQQDVTITDHTIPLAVRDHGGDGPPVLLLHGLGATLDAWQEVAPPLTGAYRVVAMDLRGHGLSGDAPWEWDAVLDDIEAVADRLGLGAPAIVGHSLGGMLATVWAARHPECPAVVNLDGLRSAENEPANYPGMDPAQVETELAQLKAVFDAQEAAMARPLPPEQAAALPPRAVATVGGDRYLRPGPRLLAAIRHAPLFRDAIPSLPAMRCPTLVVVPTQDPPGMPGSELMAALRRGIRRDLAPITEAHPHIQVVELAASHNMVQEKPGDVAQVIIEFLERHLP